jgi:hypothetical protein
MNATAVDSSGTRQDPLRWTPLITASESRLPPWWPGRTTGPAAP